MQFKEWLKIDEVIHVSFPKTTIDGIPLNSIDFRFEDWSKGAQGENLIPKVNPAPFLSGPFSASTGDGKFLNFSQGANQAGSGGAAVALSPEVSVSEEPEFQPLPSFWKRFSIWYLDNQITKAPEWPREGEYQKSKGDWTKSLGKPKPFIS